MLVQLTSAKSALNTLARLEDANEPSQRDSECLPGAESIYSAVYFDLFSRAHLSLVRWRAHSNLDPDLVGHVE